MLRLLNNFIAKVVIIIELQVVYAARGICTSIKYFCVKQMCELE